MNNVIRIMGLGILAATIASGCAAKKGPAGTAAAPAPAMSSYTVATGDHLWGIASMPKIYGNPYQWPRLFLANSNQINDPDLIFPGQNLSVERSASAAEQARADKYARSRGPWSLTDGRTAADEAYLAGN